MKTLSSPARLIVMLLHLLFAGSSARTQEYYTRTAHLPDHPGRTTPVIDYPGTSSSIDISVYPSPADQSEVSIAVNWCNPVNLLVGANTVGGFGYGQGYYYSENSGVTWQGGDVLPGLGYYTSDPAVAYDGNNAGNPNGYSNGYYNYLEYQGFGYTLQVRKTTNGGEAWMGAVPIPIPGDPDKNHMTVDATGGNYANNVYVAYTDFLSFPGSPIKFSRSVNGGTSFSVPINISQSATSYFSQGVNLAVGPNGEVYAAWAIYDDWNDFDPGTWGEEAIGFAKSTNGGLTFEGATRIREIDGIRGWWYHKNPEGDPVRVNSFPSMAVDRSGGPHHGTIYLVWANEGSGIDNADVLLIRSTNGGASWSAPVRVNDDFTVNDQWMPWVTVSPLGRVTVVFYDSRTDTTPPVNQATETWIAESIDGGYYFTNMRVSDISFIPQPVPNTATGYMGDYIGVVSTAGSTFSAWADNRTGIFQVYVDIHDTYLSDLLNVASWNRSTVPYATAYGSGSKVVYAGNRWHRLIHVNEHIAYAQSTDDGVSWFGHAFVNGAQTGWLSNPTLCTWGNRLHAMFKTDNNNLYYLRGSTAGQWEAPRLMASVPGTITGIASTVDGSGICHTVYTYTASGPSGNNYLCYRTFNTSEQNPVPGPAIILAATYGQLSNPGITTESGTNTPHVVWASGGDVHYRCRVGSLWSAPTNLSASPVGSSLSGILAAGGSIHAVWQEGVGAGAEVYYRMKNAGTWGPVQNLSNNPVPSLEPCLTALANGSVLVAWSDSSSGNPDIRYALPGTGGSGSFASTALQSHYPVLGVRRTSAGSRVLLLFTDGTTSLYQVGADRKDFNAASKIDEGELVQREDPDSLEPVLGGNSPNPFNPATTIRFTLPDGAHVTGKVYDVTGREVAVLVDEFRNGGAHELLFDGSGLSSGIYFFRLSYRGTVQTAKMMLLK
jgi:hypothetical protein